MKIAVVAERATSEPRATRAEQTHRNFITLMKATMAIVVAIVVLMPIFLT